MGGRHASGGSGERPAEPSHELSPPVAQRERQRPVMQDRDAAIAQARASQLVDHPMADDDPASRGQRTAAQHQLGDRGSDGGPPRPWGQLVDRPVDGINEPEPISLQAPEHGRFVGQVNLRVVAVAAVGNPAVEVVDPQRGRVEEPALAGPGSGGDSPMSRTSSRSGRYWSRSCSYQTVTPAQSSVAADGRGRPEALCR